MDRTEQNRTVNINVIASPKALNFNKIEGARQSFAKAAFTLAETLITIGIIGVVAALVIPVTMQNIQAHTWAKEKENFEMKINEAMNQMKTNEVLTGYSTSEDFVNAFGGYMKLIRTCDIANMTHCFVPTFTTGEGEEIQTTTLKTGKNFTKPTYTSPLVGVQFINGIQGIIAYDPQCPYVDPYNNQAVATNCLSMVYDLNGSSKPNVIGKDIYTYHATITGCDGTKINGMCFGGYFSSGILASQAEYQALKDSGTIKYFWQNSVSNYSDDWWAAAKRDCVAQGGDLPSFAQFVELAKTLYDGGQSNAYQIWNSQINPVNVAAAGLPSAPACFWAGEETGPSTGYYFCFYSDHTGSAASTRKVSGVQTICLK